jgi:hypothetical protein
MTAIVGNVGRLVGARRRLWPTVAAAVTVASTAGAATGGICPCPVPKPGQALSAPFPHHLSVSALAAVEQPDGGILVSGGFGASWTDYEQYGESALALARFRGRRVCRLGIRRGRLDSRRHDVARRRRRRCGLGPRRQDPRRWVGRRSADRCPVWAGRRARRHVRVRRGGSRTRRAGECVAARHARPARPRRRNDRRGTRRPAADADERPRARGAHDCAPALGRQTARADDSLGAGVDGPRRVRLRGLVRRRDPVGRARRRRRERLRPGALLPSLPVRGPPDVRREAVQGRRKCRCTRSTSPRPRRGVSARAVSCFGHPGATCSSSTHRSCGRTERSWDGCLCFRWSRGSPTGRLSSAWPPGNSSLSTSRRCERARSSRPGPRPVRRRGRARRPLDRLRRSEPRLPARHRRCTDRPPRRRVEAWGHVCPNEPRVGRSGVYIGVT